MNVPRYYVYGVGEVHASTLGVSGMKPAQTWGIYVKVGEAQDVGRVKEFMQCNALTVVRVHVNLSQ